MRTMNLKSINNVLITGAKGQLGFEFQRLLKNLNMKFTATDVGELDITNEYAVQKFIADNNFDCVINCAAYNDVDGAEDDIEKCYLLNTYAPEYLAKACKATGALFITYSTDFVFDGKKNIPYTEKDTPNPLSIYGKSKFEGENRVLNSYDKSFVIRTSWLFGIAGKNFNTQVVEWAKTKKELAIVDDQISSPTYAKDLAYFSWKLLQTQRFGLYHFSNDGEASKYDQAEYLLKKINWQGLLKRAKSSHFALKAQRPTYSKLDSAKLESIVKENIPMWQNGVDRWYEEWLNNTIE